MLFIHCTIGKDRGDGLSETNKIQKLPVFSKFPWCVRENFVGNLMGSPLP
jgi:hypothetical protein